MDPWYPFGKCDIAHMAIVWGRILVEKKKLKVFNCITYGGAKALNVDGYGIEKGNYADLVILQAPDPIEAIRIRPPRLAVIRRGKVIGRQQAQKAELSLGSQSVALDFTRADLIHSEGARPHEQTL